MWKKKKNNTKMAFNTETVLMAAKAPLNTVLTYFQTTSLGLTDEEVEKRQGLYGKNEIVHEQKKKPLVMLAKSFINPFVGVLTVLVAISYVMDVWMADPGDQDWTSIIAKQGTEIREGDECAGHASAGTGPEEFPKQGE